MSADDRAGEEVRLSEESIEALAERLAVLLRGDVVAGPEEETGGSLISALEISRIWGVSRRWVYDHRRELGVRELGSGKRPRLRFERAAVAERLGAPGSGGRESRRSPSIGADRESRSLSSGTRASVGQRHKTRPGAAPQAPPRLGAEWAGAPGRLSLASPSCGEPLHRRRCDGGS